MGYNIVMKIPRRFQPILWSKDVNTIDPVRDQTYIVHQILRYGNLTQIKWLLKRYSLPEVRKTFLDKPKRIYNPAGFNFLKSFILKINKNIPAKDYVQIPGRLLIISQPEKKS